MIETLQNLLSPGFDWILMAVTLLGSEAFLAGLSAVVYWCFDKPRGRLVTYVLFFGAYLNFFLKIVVPWPRPPAELRIVEKNETSYGFPSGHAQDSTTFWTWLWLGFRRQTLAVIGAGIVASVAISRVYLGLHYPAQVIGGALVGLAVPAVALIMLRYLPQRVENPTMLQALFLTGVLSPLAVSAIVGTVGEINPGRIGGYLFGFWLGALAEARYVQFTTEVSLLRKALRIVVGGAVIGLLTFVLGQVLPGTHLVPSLAGSMIQGLTTALVVPWLFNAIERGT